MNLIVLVKFELAYFEAAVQHFSHYASGVVVPVLVQYIDQIHLYENYSYSIGPYKKRTQEKLHKKMNAIHKQRNIK